jgi:2-polyprenyl-3-methyl-5-hydroxy-6-metoxy-1,4-benzoquinol methylase
MHNENIILEKDINDFYLHDDYLGNRKHSNRKPKISVLLIPEHFNNIPSPCSYIRLLQPILNNEKINDFTLRISLASSAKLYGVDVVITNRLAFDSVALAYEFLLNLRKSNAKLIYDIDDNLMHMDSHAEREIYKDKIEIIKLFLRFSDEIWVSTYKLKTALSLYSSNIKIVENSSFTKPRVARVFNKKQPLRFLYMGTYTHHDDLMIVVDAFKLLSDEGFNFKLTLIGITTNIPSYNWLEHINPPADANTYPNFMIWLKSFPMFDIGIAPLERNEFNDCKSFIKFIDYTSINLVTIASNIDVYSNIIKHTSNGFLVSNNLESWHVLIKEILMNKFDLKKILKSAIQSLDKFKNNINSNSNKNRLILLTKLINKKIKRQNLSHSLTREDIAKTILSGEGIEIGALHNPLKVSANANVKYVDRMSKSDLYKHYPELSNLNLVNVDVIDDGETLSTFSDKSQDFIIANHFIEHSEDPILTIKNLLRVLKNNGIIFMAVPNKKKTFDVNRIDTTIEHLILDHSKGPDLSRKFHYEEWVNLIEPFFGRSYSKNEAKKRVNELMKQKYSIHFHCWTMTSFSAFLDYLKKYLKYSYDVIFTAEYEEEFIFIIKKL